MSGAAFSAWMTWILVGYSIFGMLFVVADLGVWRSIMKNWPPKPPSIPTPPWKD